MDVCPIDLFRVDWYIHTLYAHSYPHYCSFYPNLTQICTLTGVGKTGLFGLCAIPESSHVLQNTIWYNSVHFNSFNPLGLLGLFLYAKAEGPVNFVECLQWSPVV